MDSQGILKHSRQGTICCQLADHAIAEIQDVSGTIREGVKTVWCVQLSIDAETFDGISRRLQETLENEMEIFI